MLVLKWSEEVEGPGDNIYAPLCIRLYKEEDGSIVPWSGTDPDDKMNLFTWYKEDNGWIFPGDQYNEESKNWQGPIHNGQLHLTSLKEKRNTEDTRTKYSGAATCNGIPREGKGETTINSYKDQCHDHIIMNGMWDIFSLIDPQNKDKIWDILIYQSIFPLD